MLLNLLDNVTIHKKFACWWWKRKSLCNNFWTLRLWVQYISLYTIHDKKVASIGYQKLAEQNRDITKTTSNWNSNNPTPVSQNLEKTQFIWKNHVHHKREFLINHDDGGFLVQTKIKSSTKNWSKMFHNNSFCWCFALFFSEHTIMRGAHSWVSFLLEATILNNNFLLMWFF